MNSKSGFVTVFVVFVDRIMLCFVETKELADAMIKSRQDRSWQCKRLFFINGKFYDQPDHEVEVYRELPTEELEKELLAKLRQRILSKLTRAELAFLGLADRIIENSLLNRITFEDEKNP